MANLTSDIQPNQYMAAIEAAEIGVWEHDLNCGLVHLSATCKHLLGIQKAGPVTLAELECCVHPDDLPAYRQLYQESTGGVQRKPYDLEYRVVDSLKGGVLRWVRSKGKATFDDQGSPMGFSGILTDISHRKAVEQHLEQSIAEFRLLADSLPQVVWTARPDGFVDYWNKRWYELTGVLSEGDESWMPTVHPDDVETVSKLWQHSLETGRSYKIEGRIFDQARGEYRWYLGMAFPVRDQEGRVVKWFGTNTDIHEQKMLATLLEQKVAERTAQLERSNLELEQFAYVASHDLQEPLRKIRTFISILEEKTSELTPEQSAAYMERIKSSALRMSNLITDLLNLSRTAQAPSQRERVSLDQVVNQACEDLELLIRQKEAKIFRDPLPEVEGIPLQLGQLFYNLLQNSLKFSRPEDPPRIYIRAERADGQKLARYPQLNTQQPYIRITVQDNGIGFEPEHVERIFLMFQRLQGKNVYEGTGIGLALCKKVVENHQGLIEAASVPGKGTTMTILLPVAK